MVLMKVVRNGKTSLNIISAKSQLSKIAENGPKMVLNDEMALIKVVWFEKTSTKIVSVKSQLSKKSWEWTKNGLHWKKIFNNCCL